MKNQQLISKLASNKEVIKHLLHNITKQQASWKPVNNKWCMLEVICHLVDEEKFDFRQRTKLVFETPKQKLPEFNPLDWVIDHNYVAQDLNEKLAEFVAERDHSISWLTSLKNPNWASEHNHPALGKVTAEFFLSNWLAHDYLHIRQLNRLAYEYLSHSTGVDLVYAGDW